MKNMKNTKTLEYFFKIRNITHPQTKKIYTITINEYSKHQQLPMQKLIEEAETEEEQGIRWKHRRLKKRLMEYRVYLYTTHAQNTARHRFTRIITFYQQFDIEIHPLPRFNVARENPVMTYSKLPDKEIIRAALDIASPVMKPIILFMASSGCARTETLNLTIQDYMDATKNYHNTTNIMEMIETLNQIDNVVPTFNILRQKTNKYYTTFCSPEAVNSINNYLLSRENLTKESKLFKINKSYFNLKFIEINNELGLGKVGAFNRFRSHMLRKFHASTLMNDGLSRETVNDLQGKKKTPVDEVYFFNNPETLKEEYIKHLPALTIMAEVEKITIKSPEVQKMELENRELKTNMNEILERLTILEQATWEDIQKEQ